MNKNKKSKKNKLKIFNKKYLILLSSLIAASLIIILNSKKNFKKTELKEQDKTIEQTINEANQKILQEELINKNKPIYKDLLDGNWDKIKAEINTSNDRKHIHWLVNQTTNEILKNGKLAQNISIKEYFDFLLEGIDKKYPNIYLMNLNTLTESKHKELLDFEDIIIKKYDAIKNYTNIKVLLLNIALSFKTKKSIRLFKEAIKSNNNTIIISAIRSVLGFKNEEIEKELIKLTKNDNNSIKALSFKILGKHNTTFAKNNIKMLIESKNPHLIEAGLYIIEEMNLINEHYDLLYNNLNNFDSFNQSKTHRLLNLNN